MTIARLIEIVAVSLARVKQGDSQTSFKSEVFTGVAQALVDPLNPMELTRLQEAEYASDNLLLRLRLS